MFRVIFICILHLLVLFNESISKELQWRSEIGAEADRNCCGITSSLSAGRILQESKMKWSKHCGLLINTFMWYKYSRISWEISYKINEIKAITDDLWHLVLATWPCYQPAGSLNMNSRAWIELHQVFQFYWERWVTIMIWLRKKKHPFWQYW